MSDNQLPKATMSNFIREHIKDKKKVSAEFTTLMLDISKGTRPLTLEFIDRVSAQANDICEKEGKKTINNEHLYKSLQVRHPRFRSWAWSPTSPASRSSMSPSSSST